MAPHKIVLKIERSDSAARVRSPRSVSDESALTVRAAPAGDGIGHYSRRLRQGASEVRFPAYSAGRRSVEHIGNAHCDRFLAAASAPTAASGDDQRSCPLHDMESLLDTFRAVWFSSFVIITQGLSKRNSSMRRVAAEVSG
jgi:hypothetical protein